MGLKLSGIKKISGKSGLKIKKIRRRSDMAVLWSAEEFIFQNGFLIDGVSNNGFTLIGEYLHLEADADNHDEADASAAIQNIDFTEYDRLDITLDYQNYANYGDSEVCYGVDGYWNTKLPDSHNERITTTITIDISQYNGMHYIGFGVWAENKSSEPTWIANANVWIKEIKLYNADVESGDDSGAVDLSSTDDGQGNVTVFALTGRVYATDDGEGNVTLFMSGHADDTTVG